MSFTNYAKNDLVYIRNIGYGTIVQCGELNVFSQRNQSAPLKKESIIFDPDLFNSETDSNQSKKSQSEEAKALLEKITNKDEPLLVTAMIPSEEKETTTETVTAEQPTEQKTAQDPTVSKKQILAEEKNAIIKIKLQNTQQTASSGSSLAYVYTLSSNITKTLNLLIKPFFGQNCDFFVLEVEFTKTIQTLKKLIFQHLNLPIANYYNIRLFSVDAMGELATHSKTLAQYGIKDCCKIVLTADNAFGWKVPPVNPLNIHKVTIVGGTVQCNREQELKALFEEEKPPIVVAESTEKSEKEKIVTQSQQSDKKILSVGIPQGQVIEKIVPQKDPNLYAVENPVALVQQKLLAVVENQNVEPVVEKLVEVKPVIEKLAPEQQPVVPIQEKLIVINKEPVVVVEKQPQEPIKERPVGQIEEKPVVTLEEKTVASTESAGKSEATKETLPETKPPEIKEDQQGKKPVVEVIREVTPLHIEADTQLRNGRHYWEIKLQKLPASDSQLLIGVCLPESVESSQESAYNYGCRCIWGYLVITGKKVLMRKARDQLGNQIDRQQSEYGYICKASDVIGVLLTFKHRIAYLTFYRNSVSCGQAYQINLQGKQAKLVPFVNISGDCNIALESKVQFPLDSYRFR